MKFEVAPFPPFADPVEQLRAELLWIERCFARHVAVLRSEGRFNEDPLRGLYLAEEEITALLSGAEESSQNESRFGRSALDARAARSPELPLAQIAKRFGLDEFERAVLVLASAPSLERRYQTLCAYAQNDVGRRLPTVDLALALLAGSFNERVDRLPAFTSDGALLRGGLVHFSDSEMVKPLADRALAIDDRVLMAVLGRRAQPDHRLRGFVADARVSHADELLSQRCAAALERSAGLVLFDANTDLGQSGAASAACASLGLGLIEADLDSGAARLVSPEELGRLLAREALLSGTGLLLQVSRAWPDSGLERLLIAAARPQLRLFAVASHAALDLPLLGARMQLSLIDLPRPDARLRARWWRGALAQDEEDLANRLALSTRIGPDRIARAVASAGSTEEGALRSAARIHAGGQLPALAQRIRPHWTWDDLLLPDTQRTQLAELSANLVEWPKVTGDWDFASRMPSPQNCIVLFSGPSGTGKTMAATLVAESAAMPLYRVNVAAVFDKYIGESEKQLERLFDAAEEAGAALLFDEADVLFGKRTELNDAHDRYANLSIAYLLQRVETFDGLAILASNLPGNMDEAFARRLTHLVAFPYPDQALRRALWARAFPAAAPLATDVDLEAIAERFELTGGNVRNAAIAAAYLAAADGGPIHNRHILRAIGRELEKTGRIPIASDFGALGAGS